ncbi:unnamed protein product [Phaedon cochleariae]|uniref:C2H2-type domain-containing protein n=1 Tax=Phaedon cochleariae TaxID=80249 RepID=A0A9N9SPW3_PHACE|nr:unnamed protein product [Phaedon cochleariae]
MYICSSCDFQHNQASRMRKHLIVHSEKFYQCDKCSLKTKHEKYLREHLKYVHRDPDTANIFVCDMCDFKTHRSNLLRKHKITHTIVGNQKKKVEMYKCEICNFKAKKKFVVQSHVNIHRPPSERVVYKCELCPYTSKFKQGVSNHMTVHKKPSEITMFECEVCPYKAKWSHCLRNHLKTHKKKEVPVHKCEHCNFKANNKYSVTTHQKSTHKELFEKPKKEYRCDLCDYTGKCTRDITRHKIVHKRTLKAEMFTCAICGMKTKRKETLKYHILTLHGFLERNLGSM